MSENLHDKDRALVAQNEQAAPNPLREPAPETPSEEAPSFQLQASPDQGTGSSQIEAEKDDEKESEPESTEEKEKEGPAAEGEETPEGDTSPDFPGDEDNGGGEAPPEDNNSSSNPGKFETVSLQELLNAPVATEQQSLEKPEAPEAANTPEMLNFLKESPTSFLQNYGKSQTELNLAMSEQKAEEQAKVPKAEDFLQFKEIADRPKNRTAFQGPREVKIEEQAPAPFQPKLHNPAAESHRPSFNFGNEEKDFDPGLAQIAASSNQVPNYLGPAPKIPLEGEADPSRAIQMGKNASAQAGEVQQQAELSRQQVFNPEHLYPTQKGEKVKPLNPFKVAPKIEKQVEEVPTFSPEIAANLDKGIQKKYRGRLDEQFQKAETAEETFTQKRDTAHNDTFAKLEEQQMIVANAQGGQRTKAQEKVGLHQENWKKRNEEIKTSSLSEEYMRRADLIEKSSDQASYDNAKIAKAYSGAEQKAQKEVARGKTKAKKKLDEVEKKKQDQSWWEKVKNAIASFLQKLSNTISAIFDKVRSAVKGFFDAAINTVKTIIAAATKWICDQIRAHAEWLKEQIKTLLADYEKAANIFCALIDEVVDQAVQIIETLADAIISIVNGLIASMHYLIDGALEILQNVYVGVVDAVHYLMTTEILQILKDAWNLALGVEAMPRNFTGQFSEEVMGTNVNDPLEGIERTPGEEALYQKLMMEESQSPEESPVEEPQAEMVEPQPEVMQKEVLANEDALLEGGTQQMSEETAAVFQELPEGETELGGGGSESVSTSDLQGKSQTESQSEVGTVALGGEQEKAPAIDFASMSDEEKLQYHIDQMGMDASGMDTKTAGQGKEKRGEEKSLAGLQAKTGILSVGTRLAFASQQMLKGMAIWWKANQSKVYLALGGILAGAGIVAFLTGGTGLVGLLKILMTAMSAYFLADAIIRIQKYIRDWFSHSKGGNPEEGGKSLARGIAVVINEFLFEYVLKLGGKILDKIKGLIAASKSAQKGIKGVKGLASKGLGKFQKMKGAVLRGGKFVLTGFKKGWSKGTKSLGELRQRILQRFGFERIWVQKKGKHVQVWAKFNPEFILLEYVDKNGEKVSYQKGEDRPTVTSDVKGGALGNYAEITYPSSGIKKYRYRDPKSKQWLRAQKVNPNRTPDWINDPSISEKAKDAFRKRGDLTKAMDPAAPGFNAHHVQPIGLMGESKVLRDAVDEGFGINTKTNGKNLRQYSSEQRLDKDGAIKADPDGVHAAHPNYNNDLLEIHKKFERDFIDNVKDYQKTQGKAFIEKLTEKMQDLIQKNCIDANPSMKVDDLLKQVDREALYKEVIQDLGFEIPKGKGS